MSEKIISNKWMYFRWFVLRFILVVYDILAVNVAHFLALVIRFYVAEEFHRFAGIYIDAYREYGISYTMFCLAVFGSFKLYSSIWKYAGFNDLNRIFFASAICFVAHIGGTLLFSMRMPITFYCIGAAIQFCLITASRFSYRLFLLEKDKVLSNRDAQTRALVVGVGGTAKTAFRELDRERDIRVMCVLNYRNEGRGSLFDGVPVVDGVNNLSGAIEKYQINYVIIATASIPQEIRNQIKCICGEKNVEVQDYTGFFPMAGSHINFKKLIECTDGPVEVVVHDRHQRFQDGKQALGSLAGRYMVKNVRAQNDVLMIELDDYLVVQNDLSEDWVRDQEKETGEAISFF